MLQLESELIERLRAAPNIPLLANVAGVGEKTLRRIRDVEGGYSTTFKTAEKIFAALDAVYPRRMRARRGSKVEAE